MVPNNGKLYLDGKYEVGYLSADNKMHFNKDKVNQSVTELIAGHAGQKTFTETGKVTYRYNSNRKQNTDSMYTMWKSNPIMQNRITQLNALVFGRGVGWTYDEKTQAIIDRFWRINRLKRRLNAIGTDIQLYGEIFIGLFPQKTGDVLVGLYESNQVDIDFDPGNTYSVNKYIVTYKDEDSNTDQQFEMMPIETYLNNIEFTNTINAGLINKIKTALGLNGASKVQGKGVMIHLKFNNATSEIYGSSDFLQVAPALNDYSDFISDRLKIHQLYGSPAYDITIETDDPEYIKQRIDELDGFEIGSNPVHNTKEVWKPLEFKTGALSPKDDERIMRGVLCAGTGFPEYLLFNQNEAVEADNTFALQKIAENRQDECEEAFTDMHKFVVAIAGGDPSMIDQGEIKFPEISTMPEKAKAESYVLKVGANICSRKTAATNLGYNWSLEEQQIQQEGKDLGNLMQTNTDIAGAVGGRFNSHINAQDPNADDGSDDRLARLQAKNTTTQIMGTGKTNN